jgi:hypothetical protein
MIEKLWNEAGQDPEKFARKIFEEICADFSKRVYTVSVGDADRRANAHVDIGGDAVCTIRSVERRLLGR